MGDSANVMYGNNARRRLGMLWLDYREKLGIGFTDIEKFKLLQSKATNFFYAIEDKV